MSDASAPRPTYAELWRTFGHIGLINFGGPAGQIALMHRLLVDEKQWIEEGAFLRALNFCTLLPGPEAQQLATYIGWRLQGPLGGLTAGLLFIVPGALVVLTLSMLYAYAADLKPVAAAFLGVKAAVLAVVLEALLRLGRRALDAPFKRWIALAAFLALAVFQAPFPLVVLAAGAAGLLAGHLKPELLRLKPLPARAADPPPLRLGRTLATIALWLAIWIAPLALVIATLGQGHVLSQIGVFFSKLALVTFGGAYAVLAYMAQEAVNAYGWLKPGEMVDGLGLAETTPGPLILVTEFVGFMAAFRRPAPFAPLSAGLIGAALTLWVTFAPCFLWIFAGAPFVERLERARRVQGALAAITAAVVGVIANLALWFGLHVLFRSFAAYRLGPLAFSLPLASSLDWVALTLSVAAGGLLLRLHLGIVKTLACCVVAGLGLHMAGLV
jgi:chromate transporter